MPTPHFAPYSQPADQFAHLPIGWTCRTSRHHPDKQYFYNPYTRTAIWDQPEEPVFDESGITTPPLPQRRQEQPATLQIRSSGRLTDHMKMAPIQDAPLATTSASNTVHRDASQDRSSGNSASQPPATSSKLRLIDRIQPARYVPPEKHETISLRPQNGPSPRPGAGSSYRPDYSAAEPRAGSRDSPRTGDAYRPERVQTSSPSLTFKPQIPSTSSESQVKDDVFASQKHVDKLPEWLEANDPKLDSEVPSDRRRMREPEDTPNRSGSSKRARLDRDARPSTTTKDLPLPTPARASQAKDQDLPRDDDSSNHASNSRLSDKPNCTFTLNRILSSGPFGMRFAWRSATCSGHRASSSTLPLIAFVECLLCRSPDACPMVTRSIGVADFLQLSG